MLKVKSRIFLAPMLEYNDIAFRVLCKKYGAGIVYTGMVNPKSKEKFNFSDKPAIQLFCNSIEGIKEFMKENDNKVVLWDFNLGCPSNRAEKCKVGAYLEDLNFIENVLKVMKKNTKKDITIKIRKSDKSFEILKIAEKYCSAICIHPRTKEQGYSGTPDINFALEFKKKSKIPVIYSGDVNFDNSKELLKKFDYVMIGRNAIGNPGIFSGKKVEFEEYLKLAKKYKIEFKQIKLQAVAFTRGKDKAARLREMISKAKDVDELVKFLS